MQAIKWMHYNHAGDHFIAVYGSHIAQVVGIELSMFEAGLLQTEQLSILGSAWCEGRQELVTAGGGFASVRCMLPERPPQLRGAVALRLTCAGDGRRGYKLVVKTDAALDGVSYQHGFAAPVGPAQTVRLPLAAFTPTFRGSAAPNAPPLRGEDIVQVGLMLSRYGGGGGVDTSVEPGGFQLRLLALEAE